MEEGRKYILPYGFVQSPLLASLCLHDSALGRILKKLSNETGVKVSVYVDDIVVSTCDGDLAVAALDEIKRAAERSRFSLNADKEEGPAEHICAFNINLSQLSLSVCADRWSEFLQALRDSESAHQSNGILGYVGSVNPAQATELINSL